MTNLAKDTTTVLVSAGTPGSPGVVGQAAYYETTTTYQPRSTTSWVFIPFNPATGEAAHYESITTSDGLLYPVTTTIFHPAVASVAPVAAIPPTYSTDYHLGWNSGARSIEELTGDGTAKWSVAASTIGAVVGLNTLDTGVSFAEIQHGFFFNHGFASVMELGAGKTAPVAYASNDVFAVVRSGSIVRYYKNDVLIHTSAVPSYGTVFLDASLYSGGDTITDPSMEALIETPATGESSTALRALSTAGGVAYSNSLGTLQALTTSITGTQSQGSVTSLQPLSTASADYAYGTSNASFEALTTSILPSELVPTYSSAANLIQPLTASGTGLTGGIGDTDVSSATLTTASADRPYGSVNVALQPATTTIIEDLGWINAYAEMTSPRGTLFAYGTEREANSFSASGSFGLAAFGGGTAKLTAKKSVLMATGTDVAIGRVDIEAPVGTLSASGTATETGRASMKLGRTTVSAYSGAVLSVRVGGSTITASGTQETVGGAAMRLPLCRLEASGGPADYGVAELVGPALVPVASGRAELSSGYKLVAYGSAVVATSYEAYTANLLTALDRNPSNQYDPDVHEVTRYTNFPFTQIVRHHNKYYGVAADGLYLLEGETDDGDPIAWSFRTVLTDAGSKQFKRVRSVYIGGRLTSQTTVTLVVGEEQDLTYSYTTPRGSNAQNYRQMFGKGVRTRYFALELSDASGNFIEVDSLDLENETLERAI